MPTYYFDITKTIDDGIHTGIQRVVREITLRSTRLAETRGIQIVPVIASGQQLYAIKAEHRGTIASAGPAAGASIFSSRSAGLRALKVAAARLLPKLYVRLQVAAFERRTNRLVEALCVPDPIRPGAGDVIIMMDSPFGGPSTGAIRHAQRNGVMTVVLVYDMIMLTHPDQVSYLARYAFLDALLKVVPRANGILTISRDVTHEVCKFLTARGIHKPVRHFYLGHDTAPPTETADNEIPAAVWAGDEPVFVMVGNLDRRKNHGFVLDAFDRLWAHGGRGKLLLIGKTVGAMDALIARCADHPERDRRLFLLHGISDRGVLSATKRADAGIIASVVEGFGLPLVEFLARGLPVLASDIPVFREVAGEHAQYFKLSDPGALADLLDGFAADAQQYRAAAKRFEWIDWDGAAAQFLDATADVLAGTGDCPEAAKVVL